MEGKPIYRNLNSLEPVRRLLSEADEALNNRERTEFSDTELPELLGAVGGAGVGVVAGAGILAAGAAEGTVGAAAITSGLAAAGELIGGTMMVGIGVVAAPAVVLAVGGCYLVQRKNKKKLKEQVVLLYHEALRKHDALIRKLSAQNGEYRERLDHLNCLVAALRAIIENLRPQAQAS